VSGAGPCPDVDDRPDIFRPGPGLASRTIRQPFHDPIAMPSKYVLTRRSALAVCACALSGCGGTGRSTPGAPVVAFLDFVEDDTLAAARKGFLDALDCRGYSVNKGTMEFAYRCANGDQATLIQACQELIARRPKLIATCPTLSTIVTAQKTKEIPIAMMVSPKPELVGLAMPGGAPQGNLIGAYETLDYLAQGPAIITEVFPRARKVGLIYNPAEPQSVLALEKLRRAFAQHRLELDVTPVNSSADAPTAAQVLMARGADAFFAMPDNVVFASFEGSCASRTTGAFPFFRASPAWSRAERWPPTARICMPGASKWASTPRACSTRGTHQPCDSRRLRFAGAYSTRMLPPGSEFKYRQGSSRSGQNDRACLNSAGLIFVVSQTSVETRPAEVRSLTFAAQNLAVIAGARF
jgi:putative ABC transport system substrate-binding protein